MFFHERGTLLQPARAAAEARFVFFLKFEPKLGLRFIRDFDSAGVNFNPLVT